MTIVRVGTFNVENLYNRYKLLSNERGSRVKKPVDPDKFIQEGGHINMLGWDIDAFGPISKSARSATAKVINENAPDILAIQEVENQFALQAFNRKWLKNAYPYQLVIDGNDPRGIDVGILSKFPFGNIRTHRFLPHGSTVTERTFSRDCLEVDVHVGKGKVLTVFVNHFKSKIGGGEEKRKRQADTVVSILKERFGKSLEGNFVVMGDLNNHSDAAELQSLVNHPRLENVIATRLPLEEQWTHYYKKLKAAEQLDYVLLSTALADRNPAAFPIIERRGLGSDIDFYHGPRFSQASGKEGASDHCSVFIDLKI